MGHRDDRARVFLQGPLEPGDRLCVEMVGGLVEEEQVGPGQEQAAQSDPTALAARQGPHVGLARREPERVHGDLEGAVELPGSGRVDLGLEVGLLSEERVDVGVGRAEGRTDIVEAVDELLRLADPLGHVAGHILGLVQLRLLGQISHRESWCEARFTAEPVVLARHDPQQ